MNVKQVQLNLIKLGFGSYLRPYGADGKVGAKTKNAIKEFQKMYSKFFSKISVDGIAGRETKKAITKWLNEAGKVGTRNFSRREFLCKGTGTLLKNGMNKKLIHKLEQLRYNFNDRAVIITSAYRSPSHNKRVGGAKNSQHLYGKACDIKVRGVNANTVYNYAIKHFDGVGKYPTFTHVDTRGYKARW